MGNELDQFVKSVGLPPGEVYGESGHSQIRKKIEHYSYNSQKVIYTETPDAPNLLEKFDPDMVHWFNIHGVQNYQQIESILTTFGFHHLLLEDIVNTEHIPKVEDYEDYIFFSLKMLVLTKEGEVEYEQLSLILGRNFVFTFQEVDGDIFKLIRDRINSGKGKVRRLGADFLFYMLIDTVVDHYFVIMEAIRDRIELLEEEIAANPQRQMIQRIINFKKQLWQLRKFFIPLLDSLSSLKKFESPLVSEEAEDYLNDIKDHLNNIIFSLDNQKEMVSSLMDLSVSNLGQSTNQVMKTLTTVSTIFIPLTFVVGLYGMNFKFMPELESPLGYPLVLIGMGLAAAGMIIYMKIKKWF